MPRKSILIFSLIVLVLAAALGTFAIFNRQLPALTGSGEKDFLGRHMLVFFGFTYCPDICPTELQVMTAAIDALGEDSHKIQPVFITVDPERDTPEVMKSYVENFGSRLVGLTGTTEDIAVVAKSYRVFYARSGAPDADNYLMDHSSILYLMDPSGRFLTHFTYSTDAAKLASALKEALAATSESSTK
jgi:cytochrome oxidase Cu insertion factor (SCO1/SenC/PrrC family)